MAIIDAIQQAESTHTVYFLLMAYVEALGYTGRASVPAYVARLPITAPADVDARLRLLRHALNSRARAESDATPLIEEAAAIFAVASQQLARLSNDQGCETFAPIIG